jgi:hypothetical protein
MLRSGRIWGRHDAVAFNSAKKKIVPQKKKKKKKKPKKPSSTSKENSTIAEKKFKTPQLIIKHLGKDNVPAQSIMPSCRFRSQYSYPVATGRPRQSNIFAHG